MHAKLFVGFVTDHAQPVFELIGRFSIANVSCCIVITVTFDAANAAVGATLLRGLLMLTLVVALLVYLLLH